MTVWYIVTVVQEASEVGAPTPSSVFTPLSVITSFRSRKCTLLLGKSFDLCRRVNFGSVKLDTRFEVRNTEMRTPNRYGDVGAIAALPMELHPFWVSVVLYNSNSLEHSMFDYAKWTTYCRRSLDGD